MPPYKSTVDKAAPGHQAENEKILYPGRGRAFFLTVFCAIFSFVGIDAGGTGWILGVLAGAGALIFFSNLLPGAARLKLDAQGFSYRMAFREHRHNWTDIESFGVLTRRYLGVIPFSRKVCFSFTANHKKTRALVIRMAATVTRFDGQLPDNYGLKARDLAALMESWRVRAANSSAYAVSASFSTRSSFGENDIS